MSSSNAPRLVKVARLAAALAIAGLTAGCFQPMYGSVGDTPTAGGTVGLADKLGAVEVLPIRAPSATPLARLAVEVRNDLIFDLTGGGPTSTGAYKLKVDLTTSTRQVIVDINSARPEIQNYGINATYSLIDGSTDKTIFTSTTFARVSYNTPGQQQRFAGERGLRDAENRAAKVIADNIRTRLASYFVAGT
jgi:LPS-assembly lipoprotein